MASVSLGLDHFHKATMNTIRVSAISDSGFPANTLGNRFLHTENTRPLRSE